MSAHVREACGEVRAAPRQGTWPGQRPEGCLAHLVIWTLEYCSWVRFTLRTTHHQLWGFRQEGLYIPGLQASV